LPLTPVALKARQALSEARLDRIVDHDHHHRNRRRRLAQRLVLPQPRRDDHVDAELYELCREAGHLLGVTAGEAALDPDVLTVLPPEGAQALEEGLPPGRQRVRGVGADREEADGRASCRGLRVDAARRPAEQDDGHHNGHCAPLASHDA
jgi:hypothetical protein